MNPRHLTVAFALFVLATNATPPPASAQVSGPPWYCEAENIRWVETVAGPQKVFVLPATGTERPSELIVFVHGDSPWGNPTYQYGIARGIAAVRTTAVVASLLRPGYADDCDHQSAGERGAMMGDNYTETVVDVLDTVVDALQREFKTPKSVMIGHSGGAALTALMASRHPEGVDHGVLVACPCDLDAWRDNMFDLTGVPEWLLPRGGLSPMGEVARLRSGQRLDVFVGSQDVVTPPQLSATYVEAARAAGAEVSLTVVEGADHEMISLDLVLSKIGTRPPV